MVPYEKVIKLKINNKKFDNFSDDFQAFSRKMTLFISHKNFSKYNYYRIQFQATII